MYTGTLHYICMECGVDNRRSAFGTYVVIVQGIHLCLSGEQLLNPSWYCSQTLSTSPMNNDTILRMGTIWSGKEFPRRPKARGMLPIKDPTVSYDGTVGELHYVRKVCTISVVSMGAHTVQIICPLPAVATSTVVVSESVRKSLHSNFEWMRHGICVSFSIGRTQRGHCIGQDCRDCSMHDLSRLGQEWHYHHWKHLDDEAHVHSGP